MKVALVCDWFHPRVGGIELHLQDLAARLGARGHDIHVVTPTPGPAEVGNLRVHRIPGPRAPRFEFVYTPSSITAIRGVLDRERFDVVHCHVSIVSPAALGGAYQAHRLGLATVLTFHSIVPYTRLLAWTAGVALGSARWPAVFSAVSRLVAHEVAPIAGGKPVLILPNGINADAWRVEQTTREPGTFELISVMRLNPKKRPLALVQLMLALKPLLPQGVLARLTIVGDGPERRRLQAAVDEAGLASSVTLAGRLTREEIRRRFAASDVFVLPTVRESFGLAALEARCAGLPVVARADSGVAELIEQGVEGLLAKSDEDLAKQVAMLARDPGLRESIAANNRFTRPNVDWPSVVERHEHLYADAIALRVPNASRT